jgi:hypothetical protein
VPPQPKEQLFEDVPLENSDGQEPWFTKWVNAAYKANLIQDCGTDMEAMRFRPLAAIKRDEAACILVKTLEAMIENP